MDSVEEEISEVVSLGPPESGGGRMAFAPIIFPHSETRLFRPRHVSSQLRIARSAVARGRRGRNGISAAHTVSQGELIQRYEMRGKMA